MLKQHPQLDLRFIIKSTRTRATNKLAMWEYIDRYFKRPWVEWQGELPDAWIES